VALFFEKVRFTKSQTLHERLIPLGAFMDSLQNNIAVVEKPTVFLPKKNLAKFKKLGLKQKGFTLGEILVAVVLIGILSTAGSAAYNAFQTNGRATALVDLASEVRKATEAFKADTGCLPLNATVLIEKSAAATTSANSCGTDLTNVWQAAYFKRSPVDGSGNFLFEKIGAGVTAAFSSAAGGNGTQHVLTISNISNDIVIASTKKCNSKEYTASTLPTTFVDGSCHATAGTTTPVGTITYLVDESN
jgi:prepilin-type N-terminal cleavage/methylation domain-containing protein